MIWSSNPNEALIPGEDRRGFNYRILSDMLLDANCRWSSETTCNDKPNDMNEPVSENNSPAGSDSLTMSVKETGIDTGQVVKAVSFVLAILMQDQTPDPE